MENHISICGDEAIYMPSLTECNECDIFEERLSTLETLLKDMGHVEISETDNEGETVTVTTVGTVTTEGGA